MYVRDDHDDLTAGYLLWLHGAEYDVTARLPAGLFAASYELLLTTTDHDPEVTDEVVLPSRSAVLLRAVRSAAEPHRT
jgi:hypothetical protein